MNAIPTFEKTFLTSAPHGSVSPSWVWGHTVKVSSENDCQISNISPVRSHR